METARKREKSVGSQGSWTMGDDGVQNEAVCPIWLNQLYML